MDQSLEMCQLVALSFRSSQSVVTVGLGGEAGMRWHAPRRKCLRVAVAGSVYASATKSKSSKSSITLRGDLDVMLRALSPRCVPAARARQTDQWRASRSACKTLSTTFADGAQICVIISAGLNT